MNLGSKEVQVVRTDDPSGWDIDLQFTCTTDDHCEGLCPSSTYSETPGITKKDQCTNCPGGKGSVPGSSSLSMCVGCPLGSVPNANYSDLLCGVCKTGLYLDEPALSATVQCKRCPSGRSTFGTEAAEHNSVGKCTLCTAGRTYNNHTFQCEVCPAGSIRTKEDAELVAYMYHCRNCTINTYNGFGNNSDADKHDENSECVACPEGQNTNGIETQSFCTPCAAGRFVVAGLCYDCPHGWKQESAGSKKCLQCDKGFYQDSGRKTFCLPCSPGTFAASKQTIDCTDCPGGWLQKEKGKDKCYPPAVGSISVGGAISVVISEGWHSTNCSKDDICQQSEPCPEGTKGSKDRKSCIPCEAGKTSFKGSTSCIPCSKGKFASSEQTSECTNCPAGFFQSKDDAPSVKCEECPSGWNFVLDKNNVKVVGSAECRDLVSMHFIIFFLCK